MGIGRWEAEARDDRKKQEMTERSKRRQKGARDGLKGALAFTANERWSTSRAPARLYLWSTSRGAQVQQHMMQSTWSMQSTWLLQSIWLLQCTWSLSILMRTDGDVNTGGCWITALASLAS